MKIMTDEGMHIIENENDELSIQISKIRVSQ